MIYEDFSDDVKVILVYLKAVAKELQIYLGASRVQIFDVLLASPCEYFGTLV